MTAAIFPVNFYYWGFFKHYVTLRIDLAPFFRASVAVLSFYGRAGFFHALHFCWEQVYPEKGGSLFTLVALLECIQRNIISV